MTDRTNRMDRDEIVRLDKAHVWHPYTPMDAWTRTDPIVVRRAEGVWLEDVDGRRFLDGNASWYVAALGHGHPRLRAAMQRQAETLAHCALAGITHEPAVRLASELVAAAPEGLSRVFFVDDGSTAIDAAVKMCVQGWRQLGAKDKTRFIALDNAFHGDSVGATSLGGVDVFRKPYAGVTFECVHAPTPDADAPTRAHAHAGDGGGDAYERAVAAMGELLRRGGGTIAAVFVEPVVQGASGMRMYDPALLREIRSLCDRYDAWLVVDEVFTGYGRTGPMWGSDHAGVRPDIMCIGKAMSAIVPMGAVLVSERVMEGFRGGRERAFLHGHTFCGNPIGASLALEVLAIYRDENVLARAEAKAPMVARTFERLRALPGVERVRVRGLIGAADLRADAGGAGTTPGSGYLGEVGWRVYDEALARGAYLRPMGNTVYVCPPLTIAESELASLLSILESSVEAVTSTVSLRNETVTSSR
jgi:adenosylmethionine-8-amino-7-oxononanoate aminotransferase